MPIFTETPYKKALITQVLHSLIWNSHQGRKKQKSMAEVSGTGRKPFAQKGTGRARAGSLRSPLHRGGGKVFAATGQPKRTHKINKRSHRLALCSVLSYLEQKGQLSQINPTDFSALVECKKTKEFLRLLALADVSKSRRCLIIASGEECAKMQQATGNIYFVTLSSAHNLDLLTLHRNNSTDVVLCSEQGINQLRTILW